MQSRVKVRVLLHFDPREVDWFELRQMFTFSSWSMYHHTRMCGRQPDLIAAVGRVPASELKAYHALPRERLGRLPFWRGDPNGCPYPDETGAVCEDAPFAADEDSAVAFEQPSRCALGASAFVDDSVFQFALSQAAGSGVGDTGGASTPTQESYHCLNLSAAKPRASEPFRASNGAAVVKCRTSGHVVCKLLHLRDAFGWPVVNLEEANDTPPAPLPDLYIPVARHAHFLLGSMYRDAHDSARKRSLQFMWNSVIPEHHDVLFIVESTSAESHRLHVHVPNASFISGDWEPDLDGYRCGEPNVVAAARREVHEETGILIDNCDMWMMDWAGVRTTVESGGAFTRLQEVFFIVNLNNLKTPKPTPLHMLHPRVVPRIFNDYAPMVPEWHTCACKLPKFLDMVFREGALRCREHTQASTLRLCVFAYAHDEERSTCVYKDAPFEHFDILFSSLDTRQRVLTNLHEDDSLFIFAWHSSDQSVAPCRAAEAGDSNALDGASSSISHR